MAILGPWPPRGFGLEMVAEYDTDTPPPIFDPYVAWAEEAFPDRSAPLPPMPRVLPVIPLDVRLFRSEYTSGPDDKILEAFTAAGVLAGARVHRTPAGRQRRAGAGR